MKTIAVIGTVGLLALGGGLLVPEVTKEVVVTEQQTLDAVSLWQAEQISKTGKYLQIKEDGVSPDGAVVPDAVKDVKPSNMQVSVYDGPNGKGYQINWLQATTTYDRLGNVRTEYEVVKSVGYGPEAKERTWQKN